MNSERTTTSSFIPNEMTPYEWVESKRYSIIKKVGPHLQYTPFTFHDFIQTAYVIAAETERKAEKIKVCFEAYFWKTFHKEMCRMLNLKPKDIKEVDGDSMPEPFVHEERKRPVHKHGCESVLHDDTFRNEAILDMTLENFIIEVGLQGVTKTQREIMTAMVERGATPTSLATEREVTKQTIQKVRDQALLRITKGHLERKTIFNHIPIPLQAS